MGLGSYQDPGEEIGGKTSSSSSSRSTPNPSQPTGGAYVASTPTSGNYSGTGGSSPSGNSSSGITSGTGDDQRDYSSYAGQGYVSNTPSAARASGITSGEGNVFNPSMPTGGAYVATTPTSGNYSGTGGSGAAVGFLPIGGGLMQSSNVSITPTGGLAMTSRSSRLASIPGYDDMFPSAVATPTLGAESTLGDLETYIREAAIARGIDPDVAVRAAKSEGLNSLTKASEGWQSTAKKNGEREPSYSPFQLLVGEGSKNYGPGLGDEFIKQTGLDPRDPKNVQATIDFALDYAAQNGWGSWYGPSKAGIDNQDGLQNAQAIGINAPVAVNTATPATVLASMYGAPIPESRPRGNPDAVGLARLVPADSATRFGMTYVHPGQELRDPGLAGILAETANRLGTDLVIQSGFRGPDHPIEAAKIAKGGKPGEHSRSAVDINMAGMSTEQRKDLVVTLRELGANRFIAYSKSPNLLHVDMKDQRGDGSAYFMFDRTAQNNAMSRAPQWYQDAEKEASGVKVAGVPNAGSSRSAGSTVPVPSDRPSGAVASAAPVAVPANRPQTETAQTFREKYINPKQIAATAIDVGAGLIPGVGTAASIFNAGASIAGKPTIGQRIVANAGQAGGGLPSSSGLTAGDSEGSSPVYPAWAQASTERKPAETFEDKYIKPQLVEGDWLTPEEKWGRATA